MTNHSTEIMNQATLDFIRQHQDDDVRQLAFQRIKAVKKDIARIKTVERQIELESANS